MPIDPNKLVTLPMVRKAMPSAIASQIAGVQPMGDSSYDQYLEMAAQLIYEKLMDKLGWFDNISHIDRASTTIVLCNESDRIYLHIRRDENGKININNISSIIWFTGNLTQDRFITKAIDETLDYVNKIDAI